MFVENVKLRNYFASTYDDKNTFSGVWNVLLETDKVNIYITTITNTPPLHQHTCVCVLCVPVNNKYYDRVWDMNYLFDGWAMEKGNPFFLLFILSPQLRSLTSHSISCSLLSSLSPPPVPCPPSSHILWLVMSTLFLQHIQLQARVSLFCCGLVHTYIWYNWNDYRRTNTCLEGDFTGMSVKAVK